MYKKINKILDSLNSIDKSNIGDKVTAGRVVPVPSNTLKPIVIAKPKKEEK